MSRENSIVKLGALTSREYAWLKEQPKLTEQEQEKVKEFETIKPPDDLSKPKNKRDKLKITKELLWKHFLVFYKIQTKNSFEQTPEAVANIAPIIKYFIGDASFANSDNLVKQVGRSQLQPSLEKGLLIIGNYGNGKTTIMRTLSKMLCHYQLPMSFKSVNCHDLVTEYESIQNVGDKYLFYERYKCRALHLDDVKKEHTANNYGKVDLVRSILEKRYDLDLKTFVTCNYREGDGSENVADGLKEFGERYGEHIYDRLFKMFNIIQFKGSSFRN